MPTYTRSAKAAKAKIRYIMHRSGEDHQPASRELWDAEGSIQKSEAYELIDQAKTGSAFFHFVLSPDPKKEDTMRDLHLREITVDTMQRLAVLQGRAVPWVGVVHADHTAHRHVHVVAIVSKRIESHHLQELREYATRECREQRKELDLGREHDLEREEEEWDFPSR